MFVVVALSLVALVILAVLVARFAKHPARARAEVDARVSGVRSTPRLPKEQLYEVALELLHKLGIEPTYVPDGRSGTFRFAAIKRDPLRDHQYLVFVEGDPPGATVDATTVLDLAEQVRSEPGTIGVLICAGSIEQRPEHEPDAPLVLIDGDRLADLCARYLPYRATMLDRYHIGGLPHEVTVT